MAAGGLLGRGEAEGEGGAPGVEGADMEKNVCEGLSKAAALVRLPPTGTAAPINEGGICSAEKAAVCGSTAEPPRRRP